MSGSKRMVRGETDWSYDPTCDDADIEYAGYDKLVGKAAYQLLDLLSQDTTGVEGDEHGMTTSDYSALHGAFEVDWLGRLLVPPATTLLDNRIAYIERMASLRTAMPFSEAERGWFFDEHGGGDSINWFEVARNSEVQLVSAGLSRIAHGRDLLQRWWSWRRETGEYTGQGSLNQARRALAGITELLAPELGLPETYLTLRTVDDEQPA